jgi:hypothetical protein
MVIRKILVLTTPLLVLLTFCLPAAQADIGTTLYDTGHATVSQIPSNAQMVAGGDAWTPADYAMFPNAQHVHISCTGTNYTAEVVDFETKCVFTQSALVNWVQQHQALGLGPGTVYTNHNNIATVQADLAGFSYYFWVADQTGTKHTYNGPSNEIATQWCGYGSGTDNCPGFPGTDKIDESLVTNPAALSTVNVPVLRGETLQNSGTGNTGSTITVNLPSGIQVGDMLVIWMTWNGTSTNPTLTGWTGYTKVTNTIGIKMFTRVADGTEGSSVSIGFAPGFNESLIAADYAGVSSVTPLDPVPPSSGQINNASTTITVPGVTTTIANDELVWFGATTGPSGATPGVITVPSGFTTESAQNNTSNTIGRNEGTILADQELATAGATGNENGASSTSVVNAGVLVSLAGP